MYFALLHPITTMLSRAVPMIKIKQKESIMKNIVAAIISVLACILLGIIFLSQKTTLLNGLKSNTENDSALVTGSVSDDEAVTTIASSEVPIVDSDIHTDSVTEAPSATDTPASATELPTGTSSDYSGSPETAPLVTDESETAPALTEPE